MSLLSDSESTQKINKNPKKNSKHQFLFFFTSRNVLPPSRPVVGVKKTSSLLVKPVDLAGMNGTENVKNYTKTLKYMKKSHAAASLLSDSECTQKINKNQKKNSKHQIFFVTSRNVLPPSRPVVGVKKNQ